MKYIQQMRLIVKCNIFWGNNWRKYEPDGVILKGCSHMGIMTIDIWRRQGILRKLINEMLGLFIEELGGNTNPLLLHFRKNG